MLKYVSLIFGAILPTLALSAGAASSRRSTPLHTIRMSTSPLYVEVLGTQLQRISEIMK